LHPILYHNGQTHLNPVTGQNGIFPHYISGSPAIQTQAAIGFDFWMSFGIGTQLAVALIGLVAVGTALAKGRGKERQAQRGSLTQVPEGRGDFPWPAALGAWFLASIGYIILNHQLVPLFPLWIIAFYALFWTPLNSYISARLIALTGSGVSFPFLSQAVVLRSGYTQPDIWFAPLPLNDYGGQAQRFREIELTGTKFTSILKLEVFMLPLILFFSFIYWGFLWKTTDIPSAQFPYAQKLWPLSAINMAIWTQINAKGGATWAIKAIKPEFIGIGGAVALAFYGVTMVFKWPLLFYYGFIGGIGNLPHFTIPTFVGALLGRYYFAKRFGVERWSLYTPVLLAGFACGTGLIGMAAIALALIGKTVSYLPF
ncbi:MAG: OPT/YSL family transporter, partial [Pseudomonadota bacterium]|nr:OPT/YSL family transporter [Pseudomonadota bacterium]